MQHFSVNAASTILERTPRTIKRALRNVSPDSYERKQPRWRLPKIIEALQQNADPVVVTNGGSDTQALVDELEANFEAFEEGYKRLQREPDIERRRALNTKLGWSHLVGKSERLHSRLMEARPAGPGDAMAQLVWERVILADMAQRALAVCEIELD